MFILPHIFIYFSAILVVLGAKANDFDCKCNNNIKNCNFFAEYCENIEIFFPKFSASSELTNGTDPVPVYYEADKRCVGKIKSIAVAYEPPIGRHKQFRTTIQLDSKLIQKAFYTKLAANKEPLVKAYYEGATIKLLIDNCYTGSYEFDSFSIVEK